MVWATMEKYRADLPHATHVADLSDLLFDAFQPLHGLGEPARAQLRHAALLHDIGYFVAAAGHHRHGAYLLREDELLRAYPKESLDFVARLVRNHRRRVRPGPEDWPRARRGALLWLSSLLRVADALDYDHQQRARIVGVRGRDRGFELVIEAAGTKRLIARVEHKSELLAEMIGGPLRLCRAEA